MGQLSARAPRPAFLRYLFVIGLILVGTAHADNRLGACKRGFVALSYEPYGPEDEKLVVTPELIAHIDGNRANLRAAMETLGARFKQMDHVTKRLILARMMETHVHISGPPGSAKSAISDAIKNIPIFNMHTNGFVNETWAIQLHQLVGDAAFKGYIDYEALKNESGEMRKQLTESDIKNVGTMIHAEVALVDELEKGNPVAFATLLDVLNEKVARYGAVTVKAKTKTTIVTSNMTTYEFVQSLTELGLGATAKPFLDRLVMKVFAHNYVTEGPMREQNLLGQEKRDRAKARARLKDPRLVRVDGIAKIELPSDQELQLPFIDFVWIGDLAKDGLHMDEATVRKLDQLMDGLRSDYNDLRTTTEKEFKENKENAKPIYYPPFIFSNRNMMQHAVNTIKTDMLIDMMLLDNKTMPSKEIANLLSKGITVHPTSIYRLHNLVSTAAPGDPKLEVSGDGKKFELKYGDEVEKLAAHPLDANEAAMLGYLISERSMFKSRFEALVDMWKQEDTAGSEILAGFAQKAGIEPTRSQADLEKKLYQAKRLQVR